LRIHHPKIAVDEDDKRVLAKRELAAVRRKHDVLLAQSRIERRKIATHSILKGRHLDDAQPIRVFASIRHGQERSIWRIGKNSPLFELNLLPTGCGRRLLRLSRIGNSGQPGNQRCNT
jgi:hypothetical protein